MTQRSIKDAEVERKNSKKHKKMQKWMKEFRQTANKPDSPIIPKT